MSKTKDHCDKCFESNTCCFCERELTDDELEYRVDPFGEEIKRDPTLHRLCDMCVCRSVLDI